MNSDYMNSANENPFMDVDREEMQKLQDAFCRASHVYCTLVSKRNGAITTFSGSKAEEDFVEQNFTAKQRQELIESFLDNVSEDVVALEGAQRYVMLRGVAFRDNAGRVAGIWLVFGVDVSQIGDGVFIPGEIMRTNSVEFDKAILLLQAMTSSYYGQKSRNRRLSEDISRMTLSAREMEYRLLRNEVLTDILKKMESNDSFSEISAQILKMSGEYLLCSATLLLRMNKEETMAECISSWTSDGSYSVEKNFRAVSVDRLPFFSGRPFTVSSDSVVPEEFSGFLESFGISAGIFLPISVNKRPGMYLCFVNFGADKRWSLDDISFANDVKRILQSILVRRITKNSLASSYSALESILENTGCGFSVNDLSRRETLFTNEMFDEMIEEDLDRIAIDALIYEEDLGQGKISTFTSHVNGKCYDLSFSAMTWVDGREVKLTTLYDISDIKNYQKKIEKQANVDYLTGLYNRKKLEMDLEKELKSIKDLELRCTVCTLNLDDFNYVNDGLGHQNGDLLLQEVAVALKGITGVGEHCYRSGGDEFIVLIDHEHIENESTIIAKVQEMFKTPWNLGAKECFTTASIGVARVPMDGATVSDILKSADLALHDAKRSGKNRVAYFGGDSAEEAKRRVALEKCLRKAVSEDFSGFEVYYQPLINIRDNERSCCGAEALVRWSCEELGTVRPDEFIPLAEYLGLIVPIGDFVMEKAFKQVKYWNDFGHPAYKVNVNLSVVQLLQNDIIDKISNLITAIGVTPKNITFEITESLALNDLKKISLTLGKIRKLGCRVALDDFGTGYSSLKHIRMMPVDTIKIDRCFARGIGNDDFSNAFVHAVSDLAGSLNVDVCVEGVEEDHQQLLISAMEGVNLVQGYLIDRPMTGDEFAVKYL